MTEEIAEEGATPTTPEPTVKYVKPRFRKRGLSYPIIVKIPQNVANQAGIKRLLKINKEDELPEVVVTWLKSDARYSWWFTKS